MSIYSPPQPKALSKGKGKGKASAANNKQLELNQGSGQGPEIKLPPTAAELDTAENGRLLKIIKNEQTRTWNDEKVLKELILSQVGVSRGYLENYIAILQKQGTEDNPTRLVPRNRAKPNEDPEDEEIYNLHLSYAKGEQSGIDKDLLLKHIKKVKEYERHRVASMWNDLKDAFDESEIGSGSITYKEMAIARYGLELVLDHERGRLKYLSVNTTGTADTNDTDDGDGDDDMQGADSESDESDESDS